ncbi:hypothetical protein NKH60_13755 [Mesorhizobium sp. M1006]|uniref:hypothetical protein n=1 Tax=Mesorhizobium sp. M1006 TaxID=2957048 RepID=UPI003334D63C
MVKSAANIIIVMEQWELEFAKEGTASLPALLAYQTIANSLRRIFETLGLARVEPPRDVTPVLDTMKLSPSEQQRFKMLSHQANEVGMPGMSERSLVELGMLVSKMRGRGVGPSATDITPRERPFHEIVWPEYLKQSS